MTDGQGGGFKAAVEETIINPVQDEVGKAVETAQQSVFGTLDPAQLQKKQQEAQQRKQEDDKKKQNVLKFIRELQEDEQRHKQLKQQEMQKKQEEEQEEQEKKQREMSKEQQKSQDMVNQQVRDAQTRTETRKGVGG